MHEDPRKQQQREAVKAECAQRGITIAPRGNGWKLRGLGVDLVVSDLANLDANDLAPYQPLARRRP